MCLAVPGQIISLEGDDPLTRVARVSFGGVIKEVNMAYLADAKVGEYVIVHAGFALSQIDEAEALKVFEYMSQFSAGDEEPAP